MGGIPDVGAQKWTPVLKNDPRRRVNASPGWYGRIRASSVPWQPWQRGEGDRGLDFVSKLVPGLALCRGGEELGLSESLKSGDSGVFLFLKLVPAPSQRVVYYKECLKIQEGNSQQTTRVILIRV